MDQNLLSFVVECYLLLILITWCDYHQYLLNISSVFERKKKIKTLLSLATEQAAMWENNSLPIASSAKAVQNTKQCSFVLNESSNNKFIEMLLS